MAGVLKRLRYQLEVILTCVQWYVAYPLSLPHLEEMMAGRGMAVDHSRCPAGRSNFCRCSRRPSAGERSVANGSISFWLWTRKETRSTLCCEPGATRLPPGTIFKRSINQNGTPETVTIDKSGANLAALAAINTECETSIKIRRNKYLNNIFEQDHRAIKRCTRPMLGFGAFYCARIILGGIEVMHTSAKGKMKHTGKIMPSAAGQFYSLVM